MSRISELGFILDRLGLRGERTARERPDGRPDCAAPGPPASKASLKQTLAARLSRLDQMRPVAEQEATAIFIETVLAHEYGAALLEQSSDRGLHLHLQHFVLSPPKERAAMRSLPGGLARPNPG